MSASPSQLTQSSKRPLEEPSSPSRANDQPEAKRPALEKNPKNDQEIEIVAVPEGSNGISHSEEDEKSELKTEEVKDEVADVTTAELELKPISIVTASQSAPTSAAGAHDETSWLHIRAVISSPEAATVIGKGGENVSNIRKLSGAKCTVSDYQKGAVERILTVSGLVDAAAKAFGLIIRTLNNEPLGEASTAQSKTYPLRLLIPHILIGSIIGKGGARIREIQEASGARLNASDSCLPLSSERSLVVMGVADAVHIATYYVGSTLVDQYNQRFGGVAASAYANRSGGPAAVVPGGLQVVPYSPQPTGGIFGRAENYRNQVRPPQHPQLDAMSQAMPGQYPMQMARRYGVAGGHDQMQPQFRADLGGMQGTPNPDGRLTQHILIPNDMVGAIIGKGGQKINEIRNISRSTIKISEVDNSKDSLSKDRLVTIIGWPKENKTALEMLSKRLGEVKHKEDLISLT